MDGIVAPEQAGVDAIAPDEGARHRLLVAATRLFARTGYAATSVREIVEAAGVTKPVLYYYFQSKEGLYLAILEETTV
jgi:AcrR family transcriptional regulator